LNKTFNHLTHNQMKKIYIVLNDLTEVIVGEAKSLLEYLFLLTGRIIVPFHGHVDYVFIENIYCAEYEQFVTYKVA